MIKDTVFDKNFAGISGGVIYYNYNKPEISNVTFVNNTAHYYGQEFASYPTRIGLVGSSETDPIILEDIGSGVQLEQKLHLAIFDMDDQIITLDQAFEISIRPKNATQSSIRGTNTLLTQNGKANFANLTMVVDLELGTANYTLNTKSIDMKKVLQVKGESYYRQEIQVNFRDCQPGERIVGNECQI